MVAIKSIAKETLKENVNMLKRELDILRNFSNNPIRSSVEELPPELSSIFKRTGIAILLYEMAKYNIFNLAFPNSQFVRSIINTNFLRLSKLSTNLAKESSSMVCRDKNLYIRLTIESGLAVVSIPRASFGKLIFLIVNKEKIIIDSNSILDLCQKKCSDSFWRKAEK